MSNYGNAMDLLEDMGQKGVLIAAPIDVNTIASKLGIDVVDDRCLEERDAIGEISVTGGSAVIRINPVQNSYEPRRRFTLAHEIGHFCLHIESKSAFTDSSKTMSRTESYWDVYESEANGFAAQLLMPKHLVFEHGERILSEYKIETHREKMPIDVFISNMAKTFIVSNKSMEYRLKNLNIIPA